jgi:hypothetical protein
MNPMVAWQAFAMRQILKADAEISGRNLNTKF